MSYLLFSVTCWQIKYFAEKFFTAIKKNVVSPPTLWQLKSIFKKKKQKTRGQTLLTLNYFISLRNLFLGADWIWTFKFLCLTRQQRTPWLCFTSPSTDPLLVPHATAPLRSKMLPAACPPSTLCRSTLRSTAWEFPSYRLKCHPSVLEGETCTLLSFSFKEILLKSDLPHTTACLPTPVLLWGSRACLPCLAASVWNDPWNQVRCFQ